MQAAISLFIGTTEIIFILFIVVMVFGADKIPEIARGLGKGMREIKHATTTIKHEVKKSVDDAKTTETNTTQAINEELNKVKDEVEDFAGSIKREMK